MNIKWQLSYALGYMQLGMYQEAENELLEIDEDARSLPDVLAVKIELFHASCDWKKLHEAAKTLIQTNPENPGGWVSAAYALRRLENITSAQKILIDATDRHPQDATIQFNLGCYAAQLGALDIAESHIRKAIELEPRFKKIAQEDEDLQPLRDAGLNFG